MIACVCFGKKAADVHAAIEENKNAIVAATTNNRAAGVLWHVLHQDKKPHCGICIEFMHKALLESGVRTADEKDLRHAVEAVSAETSPYRHCARKEWPLAFTC
ncbi:MAG: hypothetical protein DI551_02675 [Micavibrio aeruginosavorus]|uniref:BFD-like [2Fe-2S]-binding domain-containing protein n=1 Tax=Micavibrio aeruginosavorus TaxID=349221 RepID=A0A2W5N3C3_9BACT|nr:MAG: hypothetical protein DI551_02675 [Micavibrio aeruginosavorus]